MAHDKPRFGLFACTILIAAALAGCAAPEDDTTNGGTDAALSACLGGRAMSAASLGTAEEASAGEVLAPLAAAAQQNGTDLLDPIKVGTLLPLTGGLSVFGPDMQSAVELAVMDINGAGGVMGRQIELVTGDSRTDPAQAPQEAARLIQAGVVAVIGAASSGVTGSFLGQTVENGVLLVTPASTAPSLVERQNDGLFYRVPPSDALQGKVMAKLLADDGVTSVATLFVNNDYGQGFNEIMVEEFTTKYGGTVTAEVGFDDKATTFDSEVLSAASDDPDAIVYVGYPGTGVPLLRQAFSAGVTTEVPFYFSEGVFDQSFLDDVGTDQDGNHLIAGCKGTTPEILLGSGDATFQTRFESEFGHAPSLFSAQSYDAMIAIALAMAHSGSDDAQVFKGSMLDVWNAPGEKVSDVATALTLAATGTDIDWSGPSGDFDWSAAGEPIKGVYTIWAVGEDGQIETVEGGIEV